MRGEKDSEKNMYTITGNTTDTEINKQGKKKERHGVWPIRVTCKKVQWLRKKRDKFGQQLGENDTK